MPEVIPFARSYWVIPGQLLAGCVPATREAESTHRELEKLLDVGIRTVVSLIESGECNFQGVPILDYSHDLLTLAAARDLTLDYHRLSFKDQTAPSTAGMEQILDTIDDALAQGKPVYLHCWGGRGRTGTVVGCFLARHAMARGQAALDMVQYLRRTDPLADTPSPETPEQIAMVMTWPPQPRLADLRMEGLTLTVADVSRSIEYYSRLGFSVEINAAPQFALLRIGGPTGGTVGLLSQQVAQREGFTSITRLQARAIHVELSTDDLDAVFQDLTAHGVHFDVPPHDEPWERSMTAYDPDGYAVEMAQGRRGKR